MRRSTATRSDEKGRVHTLVWGDIPKGVPAPLERFGKDTRSGGVFQRSIKGVENGGRPLCFCAGRNPESSQEQQGGSLILSLFNA